MSKKYRITERSARLTKVVAQDHDSRDEHYFEQFPDRRYRVRLASDEEREMHEAAVGKDDRIASSPATEGQLAVAVRFYPPDRTMRVYLFLPNDIDVNRFSAPLARAVYLSMIAASPDLLALEAATVKKEGR